MTGLLQGNSNSLPEDLVPILDGLMPVQREAALALGHILVLAGAGTGKTRTLTAGVACRIRLHDMSPSQILCVTFSNKAAAEMRARIVGVLGEGQAPFWLGTFHGLAARQLRAEPDIGGLRTGFDIRDADDTLSILRRLIRGLPEDEVPMPESGRRGDARQVRMLAERISRMKDELVAPEEAEVWVRGMIARRRAHRQFVDEESWQFVVTLYRLYQTELRDQNAADFSDLLMWPTRALVHDPVYRQRWSSRFTSVMADEFQDVNYAQMLWLRHMASHSRELFAVGDDNQSIYSWRGARIQFIRGFMQDFEHARLFRLEENFRSTGHILEAANAVISHDSARIPKTLYTRRGEGQKIEVVTFDYPSDEADAIAAELGRRAAAGTAWHDMAIIYRQNRLSRTIEEALLKARIPYEIIGDVGFWHRAVVKDALALLTLAALPDSRQSDEAFRRVANTPRRGLGGKAMGDLEVVAQERQMSLCASIGHTGLAPRVRSALTAFRETLVTVGQMPDLRLCDRLELLLTRTGYRQMLRDEGTEEAATALENLAELSGLAEGFRRLQDLLEHAALATAGPDERGTDRVQMMTMHRAKGLEFPHVFLPAWEEAVFPGVGERNYAEERRLAYVALTRAMQQVTITWTGYRQGQPAEPSGFIGEIPHEHRIAGWHRDAGRAGQGGSGRFAKTQARIEAQIAAMGF